MDDAATNHTGGSGGNDPFARTRWTLIRQAGGENSALALQALDELCRIYWFPVYGYIRRRGNQHSDAQDLTQDFLVHFLKGERCRQALPEYGRFRALLMAAMKNFLKNEHRRAQRQKRGGGQIHFPVEWLAAKKKYEAEAADHLTPEHYFDWAVAIRLLEQVMDRLAQEYHRAPASSQPRAIKKHQQKLKEFELLKTHLGVGEAAEIPYATIAAELGITKGSARTKVNRLRKRFHALLREELARICAPEFLEDEWQALLQALSR
jgi:RNA polymerase sigma-70 factor (ECF subfamily)